MRSGKRERRVVGTTPPHCVRLLALSMSLVCVWCQAAVLHLRRRVKLCVTQPILINVLLPLLYLYSSMALLLILLLSCLLVLGFSSLSSLLSSLVLL